MLDNALKHTSALYTKKTFNSSELLMFISRIIFRYVIIKINTLWNILYGDMWCKIKTLMFIFISQF